MKAESIGAAPECGQIQERADDGDMAGSIPLGRYTRSFGLSLGITSVLNSFLVIEKGLTKGLFAWMAALTSHHWITHGLFVFLAFVIIGFGLAQFDGVAGVKMSPKGFVAATVRTPVIACLVIVAFYLIHSLIG